MYNVVRVAVKGSAGDSKGLVERLRRVDLPNSAVYFDEHTNGATFLVDEDKMREFAAEVKTTISTNGFSGRIVGSTGCSDGSFLLIIAQASNSLSELDDERASKLWR